MEETENVRSHIMVIPKIIYFLCVLATCDLAIILIVIIIIIIRHSVQSSIPLFVACNSHKACSHSNWSFWQTKEKNTISAYVWTWIMSHISLLHSKRPRRHQLQAGAVTKMRNSTAQRSGITPTLKLSTHRFGANVFNFYFDGTTLANQKKKSKWSQDENDRA